MTAEMRGAEGPGPEAACPKDEARRRALTARDALSDDDRTRLSVAICERAAKLPEIAAASTIMLFAAFRSEVDTMTLMEWAFARGKSVCCPRVLAPRQMAAYRIADVGADLVPGAWGIPEPREGLEEVPPFLIDAVAVPGAAFDTAGRRCGYGGGFYDTYLPRTRPGILWVARAFEAQHVDEVACDPHDLAVGAVVTEARVIRPGEAASGP
jgi:5-formyltetrahydrofolate cyclo-ligase